MSYLGDALLHPVGEFIQLRREIHAQPELGFKEHHTSELVASKLSSWGYSVHRGLGVTGVVGTLKRGHSSKSLGIRADMDALPIEENTQLPWQSKNKGLMHACGHDGHTASLLAAAKHIAENAIFDGVLHLIFQPAEEGGGGALRMMEDGLFELFPCDAVFALHNMPGVTTGHFVFRSGAMMASSDYVTIQITGVGGHAAMPHSSQDPIVACASIIMALQTIVSRNIDPVNSAVVTVGAVHAGQANNVIPNSATLEMSVRALDTKSRSIIKTRIHELVHAQAKSFGVTADIDWREGYTVLQNSSSHTELARRVATKLFGPSRVTQEGPPITASEDFAFMLEKVPGCYFLIGNGAEGSSGACMVHNPQYDFNDEIVAVAQTFWYELVKEYLKPQ
jgi:hippurate hydrolase